ncbi:MAG: hypothetical protein JXO22_15245 [Phycisphaerae bacterium]|nr:hypothetical protein [Phycisphaerae bacterium]
MSVWANFLSHMKTLQGTLGAGSTQVIRSVTEGETPYDAVVKPIVCLQLMGAQVTGRSGTNKQWTVTVRIQIVSPVPGVDAAMVEILSKIAQVQNKLEAYTKPDGTAGWEDPKWGIQCDTSPAKGGNVAADAQITFSVNIARGSN